MKKIFFTSAHFYRYKYMKSGFDVAGNDLLVDRDAQEI